MRRMISRTTTTKIVSYEKDDIENNNDEDSKCHVRRMISRTTMTKIVLYEKDDIENNDEDSVI